MTIYDFFKNKYLIYKYISTMLKKILFIISICILSANTLLTYAQSTPQTPILKFKSNTSANAPISIRLASTDGILKITLGEGQNAEEHTVSTDIIQMTPLTLRASVDNPLISIEGNLIGLDCKSTNISEIDLSNATLLQLLDISENAIQNVDLSNCAYLKYGYMMNNQISQITIGSLPLLEDLNVSFNNITNIDISQLPVIKNFSCDKNNLTNLDISHNNTIEKLFCKNNQLEVLNIENLTALKELSCESNKITSLNISQANNLQTIYAKDNLIESINFDNNPNLKEINISINKITDIDISSCTELEELYCFENELSTLILSTNKRLNTLSCGANKLTNIDLTGLNLLESASLSFNNLTSIILQDCSSLQAIALDHNNMEQIDFTPCSTLMMADISFNKIKGAKAESTIASLPMRSEDNIGYIFFHNSVEYPDDIEGNIATQTLIDNAKTRYWLLLNGEDPLTTYMESTDNQNIKIHVDEINHTINISGQYQSLEIFSIKGYKVLQSSYRQSLSTSILPSGVYIIRLKRNNLYISEKILL
ncbi:MAG: hypothetical protein CSA89_01055 [Bacteroidales bacterium]|nr:MAG: hypothetical protein CSA89_01055 [Bacteroidales bacterium]